MGREKRKMSRQAAWVLFLWLLFACLTGCVEEMGDGPKEESVVTREHLTGDILEDSEEKGQMWTKMTVPATKELYEMFEISQRESTGEVPWQIWLGDVTIKTGIVGEKEIKMYSMPYVEYWVSHVHVPYGTPWIARFQVAEFVEYEGTRIYGNNHIQYRNVELSFEAGDYSVFTGKEITGCWWDKKGNPMKKTDWDPLLPGEEKKILGKIEGYCFVNGTDNTKETEGDWLELSGTLEYDRPEDFNALHPGSFHVTGNLSISYEVYDQEEESIFREREDVKVMYRIVELGMN